MAVQAQRPGVELPSVVHRRHLEGDRATDAVERSDRQAMTVLLAGLLAVAVAQGGYHPPGRLLAALVVLTAVVVQALPGGVGRRPGAPAIRAALAALVLLAALAAGRGAFSGQLVAGLGWAVSALSVVGVLVVVTRLSRPARDALLNGLPWLGAAVAIAGWAGVVWHLDRLATDQDGVWRGASTLTYANAACALLTATALLTLARRVDDAGDRTLPLLLTLQLVGTGATLSRAGVVSGAVGAVVLAVTTGRRRVPALMAAAAMPVAGAVVALVALAGSYALASPPGRPVAVLGLLGGLGLTALGADRTGHGCRPVRRSTPAAGAALAGLAAVAAVVPLLLAGGDALAVRVQAGTSTRLAAHEAALTELRQHPVLGLGPGHGLLTMPGDLLPTMRYVHDEYVETALALGVPGLVLLLAALLLLLRAAARAVRATAPTDRALPAVAPAVLAAACTHAALDFLWHVPVVPLVTATLVAAVLRPATTAHRRGSP